jgi:hypothetical protein
MREAIPGFLPLRATHAVEYDGSRQISHNWDGGIILVPRGLLLTFRAASPQLRGEPS